MYMYALKIVRLPSASKVEEQADAVTLLTTLTVQGTRAHSASFHLNSSTGRYYKTGVVIEEAGARHVLRSGTRCGRTSWRLTSLDVEVQPDDAKQYTCIVATQQCELRVVFAKSHCKECRYTGRNCTQTGLAIRKREGLVIKEIGRHRKRSERMRWLSLSLPLPLYIYTYTRCERARN